MTGIRFPPDRAGWLVVTRNDRWAWAGLIGSALACILFGFTVIFDATRREPFHWFVALYFVFTFRGLALAGERILVLQGSMALIRQARRAGKSDGQVCRMLLPTDHVSLDEHVGKLQREIEDIQARMRGTGLGDADPARVTRYRAVCKTARTDLSGDRRPATAPWQRLPQNPDRWSIRYCDDNSGGQAISGLPISHSWPNGSMSLPTRQPCSSSTGDLPCAPAATA